MSTHIIGPGLTVSTDESILLHEGTPSPIICEGMYLYHEQHSYYKTHNEKYFVLTREYKPKGFWEYTFSEFFHNWVPKNMSNQYAVMLTAQECATKLVNCEGMDISRVSEIFQFQPA